MILPRRQFLRLAAGIAAPLAASRVAQAQSYVAEGHEFVVDIDLEKFFDRVNHDILMDRVSKRISDKRLLRFIRAYLNAGVMENGLVGPTDEGGPARRPTFTPAFESRTRRIRPRTDPPESPLLPRYRRLQHLRGQPPVGGARHVKRLSLPDDPT